MRKGILAIVVVSIIAIISVTLGETTEEDKIKMTIRDAREGIEQENLSQVMSVFSKEYSDNEGSSFDSIKGILMRQFLKTEPVTIQLSPLRITTDTTSAQVEFEAAVLDGENASIFAIPNEADVLFFTVDLRKEDETWRIVSHQRHTGTNPKP